MRQIDKIILKNNAYLSLEYCFYTKGQDLNNLYVKISSDDALGIIKEAYFVRHFKEDSLCGDIESEFLFSLSKDRRLGSNEVVLIVCTGRKISKMKRKGTMYQDASDDGNNEGSIAKVLRSKMPVLVLT